MYKLRGVRAQSTIEFVILIASMLFFFILLLFVIQSRTEEQRFQTEQERVREVGLTIQSELSLAKQASGGYERIFEVPTIVNGKEYTLQHNGNRIQISTDKVSNSYTVANVTGTLVKGLNTIKKQGGEVLLNQ